MTAHSRSYVEDASKLIDHYFENGYSFQWKAANEWRSVWGITGIKIQVREHKIIIPPPDVGPIGIYSRWKTVSTF